MTMFGEGSKENLYEDIVRFIEIEKSKNTSTVGEIAEDILEVVATSLKYFLYE